MQIETIPVGFLEANCYLVTQNNQTIIIDPGDEIEKILNHIKEKNIVGILVTHHHFDHIGALQELEERLNLTHNIPPSNWNYKVLKNPGHSKDSISFYFEEENILFSGDFIFKAGIGRWDLEGGDLKELQNSIKIFLKEFQDVKIYPGHGLPTTLQKERSYLETFLESC